MKKKILEQKKKKNHSTYIKNQSASKKIFQSEGNLIFDFKKMLFLK